MKLISNQLVPAQGNGLAGSIEIFLHTLLLWDLAEAEMKGQEDVANDYSTLPNPLSEGQRQ